ncbi:hypothetical protein ACE6H2_006057 [Prunus campanulata]
MNAVLRILMLVPYLTLHSQHDTWTPDQAKGNPAARTNRSFEYESALATDPIDKSFKRQALLLVPCQNKPSVPATERHQSTRSVCLDDSAGQPRIPRLDICRLVSTSEDTPTSPTSKLSTKSIPDTLYKRPIYPRQRVTLFQLDFYTNTLSIAKLLKETYFGIEGSSAGTTPVP